MSATISRLLLLLLLAVPRAGAGEPEANFTPVNLLLTGSLLGRVRGFCEPVDTPVSTDKLSCSPNTAPFGGLLGLSEKLGELQKQGGYTLLAGNNFPSDFAVPTAGGGHREFWTRIAAIKAAAIALGGEDLLRAAFPAGELPKATNDHLRATVDFLQHGAGGYQFLASNVFVRTKQKGTNHIYSHGYKLLVDADQTVQWTTKELQVQMPLHEFLLRQHAHKAPKLSAMVCGKKAEPAFDLKGSGNITLPAQFEPGQSCDVSVSVSDGNQAVDLSFQVNVDEALTPWSGGQPEGLNGAPVAFLSGHGPRLMVVSLIDPAVLDLLESSRWTYKSGSGQREIVVLPPDKIAKVVLDHAATEDLPVLLSDLSDSLNMKVLKQSTRWRVVALNPDTAMLGCLEGAQGCTPHPLSDDEKRYSYRSGDYAILGGAQVWTRPEWVGESIIQVTGALSDAGSWQKPPTAETTQVKGYVREKTALRVTTEMSVQNFVDARGAVHGVQMAPQKDAGVLWWKTREDVALVLMEAMRSFTRSEFALADLKTIDQDVVDELRLEGPDRLTYADLRDIFWRHDAYVRVFVKGSDLAGLLGKIAKLPADDDGGYCLRGLASDAAEFGCKIPENVDASSLRVNGRTVNAAMVYSLAAPQALAHKLSLGDPKDARIEVVSGVERFLSDGGLCRVLPAEQCGGVHTAAVPAKAPGNSFLDPQAAAGQGGGAKKEKADSPPAWRNPYVNRWLGLFYISPASLEVGGQNYHVPGQEAGKPDTSGFSAIPAVGEKVSHTFKFNMAGEVHLVPVNFRLLTLDILTRVSLNRLDTYPNTVTGVKQIAYTPDLWTSGAALHSQAISDVFNQGLARARLHTFQVDPFVGYFEDTSIFHFDNLYQTKAKDASGNPLFTLQEQDRKPSYLYFGAGLALGDIKLGPYVTVKKTVYEHDSGVNYAEPTGLVIGTSQPYSMDLVRRCGIQSLIDGGTGCPAAPLDASHLGIRYLYREERQGRHQFSTSFELAWGGAESKRTVTLSLKGNRWGAAPGGYTPLDPLWTTEMNLTSAFPIFRGIAVGPYLRYYFVKAFGSPGTFESNRYGFTLTLPVFGKAGHGRLLY